MERNKEVNGYDGIELSPKYTEILTTDKRYVIITGGRGSGKSFAISTLADLMTYEAETRILYTRYTMVSAKISIIPEFTQKLELLKVRDDFDPRDSYIKNTRSGSDILFRGLKTSSGNLSANMKSISGVNIWILDEAEELVDEEEFEKIDYSIRKDNARNLVVLILNPTTIDHFIYKRFFKNSMKYVDYEGAKIPISTHPDVLHIHTTYRDNDDNLSDSFLKQAQRLKEENIEKYHRIFMGSWLETAEGAVYKNWTTGEFDRSLPYCYAQDYGYSPDPSVMIKMAVDRKNKRIYIKECFYDTEMSHEEIVDATVRHLDRISDVIITEHDKRIIRALQDAGLNVKQAKKRTILEGIMKIQDYEIVIDPLSFNVMSELRLYEWNDKKASIPVDKHNHAMDAMRYGFEYLGKGRSRLGLKFYR